MTIAEPRARSDYNDPDRQNAEQEESGSQAQDVAADALADPARLADVETEHGGRADRTSLTPDDEQDVVDHMTDMVNSGRIDMDAFEGEESMDDEDGSLPD